jgi:hypothetical protein
VLTESVQVLAGVLLPSARVFLLLYNDREVLGPWVNGHKTNLFTSAVVSVLVTCRVILTASVPFPAITAGQILPIMTGCVAATVLPAGYALTRHPGPRLQSPAARMARKPGRCRRWRCCTARPCPQAARSAWELCGSTCWPP